MSIHEGTQKEVKAVAKPKPATKEDVAAKLEAGYRYVTIPSEDLYNYKFNGISINLDTYTPGTHLVPADVADTLEDRLKVWNEYNVRLMRPQADVKALRQIGSIA